MTANRKPRAARPRSLDMGAEFYRKRARRRPSTLTMAGARSRVSPRPSMTGQDEGGEGGGFDFYGPQYARFDSELAAELRREVYGEDIGQQGWRTAAEQAEIADLL